MIATYLAIENDTALHKRESKFWLSKNIGSLRVSTMNEGIAQAIKRQFYYIGINASNVNYQPKLVHLREVTNAPILIATSTYTMQEQGKALSLGADLFGQISDNPNDNYNSVVAQVNRINERAKKPKPVTEIMISGEILMSRTRRQVYFGDEEVEMTRMDFDLLFFLMSNRGHVFSAEQLYHYLWDGDKSEAMTASVKAAITRIRKKLPNPDLIENVWGQGYRFPMSEP